MKPSIIKLSWQLFRQQYHTSDNRLLRWIQGCLLFFLLSLSLSSVSIQTHLEKNLQQLLGADLVLSQYQPLTESQLAHANSLSTNHTLVQLLGLTLTNGEKWQKVKLKLVGDNYPLQGNLTVSDTLSGETIAARSGPRPGEIWVDARLFSSLELSIGQSISIAEKPFRVTRIIHHEPDKLLEGHGAVSMRAMIHADEIGLFDEEVSELGSGKATEAQYRYLFETNSAHHQSFLTWTKKELPGAQVVHRGGGHPLALFWQRTENFLGLASVLLFLMAAIAIDLTGRRQLINQKRFVALCLSMGISRTQGITLAVLQWFIGFILLLIPALILASITQVFIIGELQAQFPELSSQWQWLPIMKTIVLLLALLAIFQIPGWMELSHVSVPQLIRQQSNKRSNWIRFFWSILSITGLAVFYSDNGLLTGFVLGAMLATLLLMMSLTWILLMVGEKVTQRRQGLLPFTFFIMKQRLLSKSVQILGVGLCVTLLLFTLVLMKDMGNAMQGYVRHHDGNLMITRAQAHQVENIKQWAKQTGSQMRQLKPYLHGQVVKINGASLSEHTTKPSDSMAALKARVRLHWSAQVPANNQLQSGQWWTQNTENWNQVSVEEEVMTDIGLKLGDRLSFLVEGKVYDFVIKATHVYKPGNGSITFWFQVPPEAIKHIDANQYYMGSMELPENAWPELSKLWQQNPRVYLLPIREMTERFDNILAIITKLVTFFSAMIIFMAVLVITASVKGYEVDDRKKNGLLLSFGLPKSSCVRLSLYEWLITALIAAIGAIVGTWLAGELIYQSQFSMNYVPDVLWLSVALVITTVLVCCAGLISSRASLNASIQQLVAQ
ncbi:ABC transporter permease [Aliikangiella coralliicola]|uniref:FtsX-like permease family protein n=1 Tax=Aliikangiella coralliicola TaxID=2592383 RepID=A0A545UIL3_9GAMM|nr:FtsX-like permease family protein [Aliikangiella coralliicola]TQV89300.1 FtsX-like permease family protein [Aliikangiella coralliicola]